MDGSNRRIAQSRMTASRDELRPRIAVRSPSDADHVHGVVLVLPGGRARSTAPASRRHLAYQRMRPFGVRGYEQNSLIDMALATSVGRPMLVAMAWY